MGARGSVIERFWRYVNTSGDCWEWTASTTSAGYGQLNLGSDRGTVHAHRLSAQIHFGMFDRRLWVLHHCDNRRCVRPEHLYLGDREQNIADFVARDRSVWKQITHCPQGHEYTPNNTYQRPGHSNRYCRACHRDRTREYQRTRRAKKGGDAAMTETSIVLTERS